jgi:cell division protein FtsL
MIEAIAILIGIIIVLGFVFWLILKAKNKKIVNLKDDIKDLNNVILSKNREIARKKLSMEKIKDHQERIKFTEKELSPIKKQVKEATSEEDVLAAIGNLVDIHNRRM